MIGPVGFGTRNLQRRGFHALLAFVGLTVTTASTIFLLLVGQSLISTLNVEFNSKSTLGISYLFLGYIMLALSFIIVVGLLSAGYLVSTMISQRTRDIGVIKAAGYTSSRLFAYALTEAMLVFLASSLAGAMVSSLLYVSWTGSLQFNQAADVTIAGVSILSFLLSYFAARFQVWRILKASSANAISSQLSNLDLASVGKPLRVSRFGSAFNMSSRTMLRNKRFTRTVVSITVCVFLSTTVLSGALVSADSSRSYVQAALPQHVLVVGTPQMVDLYTRLGQSFSSSGSIPAVDGFNSSNIIDSGFVNQTRALQGVEKVDARLMNMTTAEGKTALQIGEDQNGNPTLSGLTYLGKAQVLLFGVDPTQTIGNWHSSDGLLSSTDAATTVVVGDSLIGGIVQQPLNGSEVMMLSLTFQVKGAVVEPINRGQVVYAPVHTVQTLLGLKGYNVLLVQTDGSDGSLQRVQQIAGAKGFVVGQQDEILNSDIAFLDSMWLRITILPLLTMILTGAILLSYLSSNFSARFNDYTAIRVLGARGAYVLKLLLWEGGSIVLLCALLGLPLAIIFSSFFFVAGAPVQVQHLGFSAALALLVLGVVAMGSGLGYWKRLSRVTVKDLVP